MTREEAIKAGKKPDKNNHITRFSDASTFDEICILCGATDDPLGMRGDERGKCGLDYPCEGK